MAGKEKERERRWREGGSCVLKFNPCSLQGPFDVVRMVFCPRDGERELTLNEKSDLFFHDYSMASLFVQENYVRAKPNSTRYGGRPECTYE